MYKPSSLFIAVSFVLIASALLIVSYSDDVSTADGTWTSGDCTVTILDGVMTISGEGKTADYDPMNGNNCPWRLSLSSIESIVVEEGVTYTGSYLTCVRASDYSSNYSQCPATSITLPESLEEIAPHSFYNCTSLTEISMGEGVPTIGDKAFGLDYSGNTKLESFYFGKNIGSESVNFLPYYFYVDGHPAKYAECLNGKTFILQGSEYVPPVLITAKDLPSKMKYTGAPIIPDFSVCYDWMALDPSTYTVTGESNTDVGYAYIHIKSKPGSAVTFDETRRFSILPRDENITINGLADAYKYTGIGVCPDVTASYKGMVLDPSQYVVTYDDNIEVGNATVTLSSAEGAAYKFCETWAFKITKLSYVETGDNDIGKEIAEEEKKSSSGTCPCNCTGGDSSSGSSGSSGVSFSSAAAIGAGAAVAAGAAVFLFLRRH